MGRTVEHIKIVEEDLRSPRIFQAVYGMSEGFFWMYQIYKLNLSMFMSGNFFWYRVFCCEKLHRYS